MGDLIDRQAAISAICNACGKIDCDKMDKCEKLQLPPANCSEFPNNSDTISRQAAIEALGEGAMVNYQAAGHNNGLIKAIDVIKGLPSAQPEPFTDKEQRIFLAAMGREEKVCEEVDRNYVHEPYEDSLMSVCKAIRRKVKGALWI